MSLSFSGLRIVDFTQVLSGPGATHLFCLLGADVIKIENPQSGDQMRQLMPTDKSDEYGMSPGFMSVNYGKRSVALDLKHPAASEIITKLLESADVVVENFRAGAIEKLGYGYDAVKAIKPDIIYCSISGYGQQGPMRGTGAYDGAIQAASGMMSMNGHESTGPTRSTFMSADMSTALSSAFAISSALYRRSQTGEGQRLDVSMMDTAIWLMNAQFARYFVGDLIGGLEGNTSPTRQPTADVFPTADGYVQISALSEGHVASVFEITGLDALYASATASTPAARADNREEIYDQLVAAIGKRETKHWVDHFIAAKIPCAEIRDVERVTTDPQLDFRDVIQPVPAPGQTPGDEADMLKLIGAPFIANVDGPAVHGPPPVLGEHTQSILSEMGYSAEMIAQFQQEGLFGDD